MEVYKNKEGYSKTKTSLNLKPFVVADTELICELDNANLKTEGKSFDWIHVIDE